MVAVGYYWIPGVAALLEPLRVWQGEHEFVGAFVSALVRVALGFAGPLLGARAGHARLSHSRKKGLAKRHSPSKV